MSRPLGRIGLAAKIAAHGVALSVAFAACGLIVRDGKVLTRAAQLRARLAAARRAASRAASRRSRPSCAR